MNYNAKANYQNQFEKLKLDKLENDEERIMALDTFSSKYLLLPEAWKMRIRYDKTLSYHEKKKLIERALSDFYSEDFFDSLDSETKKKFEEEQNPFDRCLKWRYLHKLKSKCFQLLGKNELEQIIIDAFSFPHSNLKEAYTFYTRFTGKFATSEILSLYSRNNDIYNQIIAAEKNLTEWCFWIKSTKDNRFIIQNFECRLAKYPFEIQLWKIYMCYLKTVDEKAEINVLNRYRRIFINDNSMNCRFNIVKMKRIFENSSYLQQSKFKKISLKRNFSQSSTPNLSHALNLNVFQILPKIQKYPFRFTLLNFIIRKASMKLLYKFYQCCRQLYLFKNIPFCHSIFVGNNFETKYFKDSVFVNEAIIGKLPKALCLEMNLIIEKCSNVNLLSQICPKLKSCNIQYLKILHQNFSTAEYEMLTKSQKIRMISLLYLRINDKNGNAITFHDLLKNLSNAFFIEIPIKVSITPEITSEFLTKMKKEVQIGYLCIMFSISSLNFPTTEFIEFFANNKRESSLICITFDKKLDDDQKVDSRITVKNAFDDWNLHHPFESKSHLFFVKFVNKSMW